jgi:hypothetical protein
MNQNQQATKLAITVLAAIERSIMENERKSLSFPMYENWTLDVEFENWTVFLSFTLPVSRTIPTYESTAGVNTISAQFFHFQWSDLESQVLAFGNEVEHQILNFINSICTPPLEIESQAAPDKISVRGVPYKVIASKRYSLSKTYNEGDIQLICCKSRNGYTLYNIVLSADGQQIIQNPIVMPEEIFGSAETITKEGAAENGFKWHLD